MSALYCFICRFFYHLSFGLIRLCDDAELCGTHEDGTVCDDTCEQDVCAPVSCDPAPCDDCCDEPCEQPPVCCGAPAEGGYARSIDHLNGELCVIDLLVRAQVCRWYRTIATHKRPEDWGMLNVNPQEVQAYLKSSYTRFGEVPPHANQSADFYIEQARNQRELVRKARNATPDDVQLRLRDLQIRLDVADDEVDSLLLSLLPALDSRYRRLFAILQDNGTLTRPTPDFMLQVLGPISDSDPPWARRKFMQSELWKYRVLSMDDESAHQPFLSRAVRLDEAVANYLIADPNREQPFDAEDVTQLVPRIEDVIEDRVSGVALDSLILENDVRKALQRLHADREKNGPQAVNLFGRYGSGRRAAAKALVGPQGNLLVANLSAANALPGELRRIVDLCYRDARLNGTGLAWTNAQVMEATDFDGERKNYILSMAEREPVSTYFVGSSLINVQGHFRGPARPLAQLPLPIPSMDVRRRLWNDRLPPPTSLQGIDDGVQRDRLAHSLAKSFQLNVGQIEDAIATARSLSQQSPALHTGLVSVRDIETGCRSQAGRSLGNLATHIAPREYLGFSDLILPKTTKNSLQDFSHRIYDRAKVFDIYGFERRHRLGKGLLAMFTGASGTGKSLAAEVIASENKRDLYKVDVSQIVSKWVGETEKNMERIFIEATDSNAILFFDEADAFFGKRGEVNEAKDRWANQEVNYLLQRIEEYPGIVIMATNLQQNIDQAFLRRIQYIIDFPFPNEGLRQRLWENILEKQYVNGEVDESRRVAIHNLNDKQLKFLADRFVLSGGNIRSIVFDAAFRQYRKHHAQTFALDGGKLDETYAFGDRFGKYPLEGDSNVELKELKEPPPICYEQLLESVAREYQKQGRPIRAGDFGRNNFELIMEQLFPEPQDAAVT